MNDKQELLGKKVSSLNISSENEVSTVDKLYAYPYGYGKCSGDLNLEITDQHPLYPTKNCYQVEIQEIEDGYRVVSARRFDTSSPTTSDEWVKYE